MNNPLAIVLGLVAIVSAFGGLAQGLEACMSISERLRNKQSGKKFPNKLIVVAVVLLAIAAVSGFGTYLTEQHTSNTPSEQLTPSPTPIISSLKTATTSVTETPSATAPTNIPASTPTFAPTPTPTLTPQQALYIKSMSGTPVIDVPLVNQDSNYPWDVNSLCVFTQGAYHSSDTIHHAQECYARTTNFSNFALKVDMTILQGDEGGLIFGYGSAIEYRYGISLYPSQLYAHYDLWRVQPNHAAVENPSPCIHKGLGQHNLLVVIVKGTTIYLYINGYFLAPWTVDQGTPVFGAIGLFSDDKTSATEVAFSNLKVWQL